MTGSELLAGLRMQRRDVERLLGSKNECSSKLHHLGTQLIRTHERLLAIAEAALRASTDDPGRIASSIEHSHLCAIWVEVDDVGTALQPIGRCDCGLSDLLDALDVLRAASA